MKKNYIILSYCLILTFCISCSDFLEEQALDTYTTDNFPQSESDAEALVNEIYNRTGTLFSDEFLWLAELPAETTTTRRQGSDPRAQLDEYNVLDNNDHTSEFWEDSWIIIKQANAVIDFYQGQEANIDPELAERLVAEARALRATSYFYLAIFFGDVPLILNRINTLEATENPIAPLSSIYESVISDLEAAEPFLPHSYDSQDDQGRVTRGAVRALLGKVYLQRAADPAGVGSANDNQLALDWMRKVRDRADGGFAYELEPEYINLFGLDNVESAKRSNEIVYQFWRNRAEGFATDIHAHLVPRDATHIGTGRWGNFAAEVPFYLSFESTDERFHVTFMDTIYTESDTLYYDVNNPGTDGFSHDGAPYTKNVDENSTNRQGGTNVFLIRYADVLLTIAEALNEINDGPTAEAYDMINQVRARARTTPGTLPDLSGLTYDEFREALFNELRWELSFEGHGLRDGHRFFNLFKQRVEEHPSYVQPGPVGDEDAGRQGDAVPDVPIDVTIDKLRFPIPLVEKRTNPAIGDE